MAVVGGDEGDTTGPRTLQDVMRGPPLIVKAGTSVSDVRALLLADCVPAIAVCDERDRLLGVVTPADVLRARDRATARDAMSSFLVALPASAALERAAALIATECVSFVVVIALGRRVLGMVSALDIIRCRR